MSVMKTVPDCLKPLQLDSTFVVWKLDRLGRNVKHLLTFVDDLNPIGFGLSVLAGTGAEVDTTTANGPLLFSIFAAPAVFEREPIAERTGAGMAPVRAKGRLSERSRKIDLAALPMAMAAMASRDTNARDFAHHLSITKTTLFLYVNCNATVKELDQKLLDASRTPE